MSFSTKLEMALAAVKGSSLPETVCGKDERVQVDPMTSPPYKWICFLSIESASGRHYVASGFKIHLPGVNRTAIVTSGHCTYLEGAYAAKITVKFPGQSATEVSPDDLFAAPEFIYSGNSDHDYGLILLPGLGTSDDGFGWSAIVADEELNDRIVNNCGYPGDKPRGTMWITGGKIISYTANRIFYMNDTMGGQSGSPVYTWYDGYWTVIGVHSYGGCPNSAPRFTTQMICRFLEFMNSLKVNSLRSFAFPNVYVRCDGSGVTKAMPSGGGTVNCQYKPPGSYEKFYICPVEVTPSLASVSHCKVEIRSTHFNNIFIRLDGQGMSQTEPTGGGEVNCQYTAGTFERFYLQERNGCYSFRSVQFPHCYIRLDGEKVHSQSGSGGGTVNCQWYNTSSPPGTYERFYVEEH